MSNLQYDVFTLALAPTTAPQRIVAADNRKLEFISVRSLSVGVPLLLRLGVAGQSFAVYQGDQIDLTDDDHRAGLFYETTGTGAAQILVTYGDVTP